MSSQLNLLNISDTAFLKKAKPDFAAKYPTAKESNALSLKTSKSLETALKTIFPSQKEETRL